ncbi:MAG TPA: hypothetical protein VMU90_11925 [Solirubrobacteraceae bacterium]|nr:hypothetical protein [Solirubrobacteraceae bacterium]
MGHTVPTRTVTPEVQVTVVEQFVPTGAFTPGIQFELPQFVPTGTFTPGMQLELPEIVAVVLAEPLRPVARSNTVSVTVNVPPAV